MKRPGALGWCVTELSYGGTARCNHIPLRYGGTARFDGDGGLETLLRHTLAAAVVNPAIR